MNRHEKNLSRRSFLRASACGTGLLLGFPLLREGRAMEAAEALGTAAEAVELNAYLTIDTDEIVTVMLGKSEMGQSVYTTLPALIAEELRCDWDRVHVRQSPPGPPYRNPGRPTMITGGSSSIRGNWERLRQVGAAARHMLVTAAARRWKVDPKKCKADGGVVYGPSGQEATFGELAREAAAVPPPEEPELHPSSSWQLLGRDLPRLDTPSKVTGQARFSLDVDVPGMLHAAVRMAPVFGADVIDLPEFTDPPPGTVAVVPIPGGVGVVATSWWAARKAAEALPVKFSTTGKEDVRSEDVSRRLKEGLEQEAAAAHSEGDTEQALSRAHRRLEAVYELPYLAHATMEPQNCTARVGVDFAEVWAPTQAQEIARQAAAAAAGLKPEQVTLHTTLLGGGFGRRFETDFVVQAVTLAKAVKRPVKVLWTREQDTRHDFYRPAFLCRLRAGIDSAGHPVAWEDRVVAPSIMSRVFPGAVKDGLDMTSLEGAVELPYAIPNVHVDYVLAEEHVPVGFWRSVGHSQNAFAVESFIDELAHAAGKDPVAYRLQFMPDAPRHRGVLEMAADRAGWGTYLPKGIQRGVAVHKSFGSYVAQVAEVSVDEDGEVTVHRVVCAVDCGAVANPDTIEAQIQSAIVYGLTAALRGRITLKDGAVQEGNFDSYEMLRMHEMPRVEVHILSRDEPPGGIGEPGLPPIAPAVCNALFALTGKRIRRLPIDPGLLTG